MNRWYKSGKPLLEEIEKSNPCSGEAHIWFTGQHGFIVNLCGIIFYIDVILSDFLDKDGNTKRVYPPPFSPDSKQRVDFVLCTHNHIDHLNLETLLPLAKANFSTRFVVPAPFVNLLTEAGIEKDRVIPARAGENIPFSHNAHITPVPAFHTKYIQNEGEKDENGDFTSLGFILEGNGLRIYHSGDTWATPSLIQTLKTFSPIDIAMLPINGTDWERTERNCFGNMASLDAVKLAKAIPTDLVIPAHYDLFAHNSENPARFAELMYTHCPEKRYHIFALGEKFIYENSSLINDKFALIA